MFQARRLIDYPATGGIENARQIAAHESPRSKDLFDQTSDA
jgi:hypothetical protein